MSGAVSFLAAPLLLVQLRDRPLRFYKKKPRSSLIRSARCVIFVEWCQHQRWPSINA